MKGFFSKLKKNKKGFTLTELIVVVAILGVLAVIAVPMIMNSVSDAKESADQTSIQAISTAVDLCLAEGKLQFVEINSGGSKYKVIRDEKGDANIANIKTAIREKLKGFAFPEHAVDDENLWKLDLRNAQVSYVGKGASSQADQYIILDE